MRKRFLEVQGFLLPLLTIACIDSRFSRYCVGPTIAAVRTCVDCTAIVHEVPVGRAEDPNDEAPAERCRIFRLLILALAVPKNASRIAEVVHGLARPSRDWAGSKALAEDLFVLDADPGADRAGE